MSATHPHPTHPQQTPSASSASGDPLGHRFSRADLDRHIRKCAVCNHPQREQIEDDFLRWRNPWDIVTCFALPSRSCLYRHAEAHGLILRRRRNLRGVAERILERVDGAHLTANAVLHAMRLFAHITEDGQWIEPPKRAIVTHVHAYPDPNASPPPRRSSSPGETGPPAESRSPSEDDPANVPLAEPARRELESMLRGIHTRRKNPREEAARLKLLNESLAFQALIHRDSPPDSPRRGQFSAEAGPPPGDTNFPDASTEREILIGTPNSGRGTASD